MITEHWNKETYKSFLNSLYELQDKDYQQFQKRIIVTDNIIGVRTPILKSLAKEIAKGDYNSFFYYNQKVQYEEKLLYGLVLGYIKIDFDSLLNLLDQFIIIIDNWAINDVTCANLKAFKKNQEQGYEYILKCLNSKHYWSIRFGLVMLIGYYINDLYIDKVLKVSNQITNEEYYVKMANAWLISICYIKYPEKTIKFLETTKIDNWTYNKAIQKIIESTRVRKEEKDFLRTMKK